MNQENEDAKVIAAECIRQSEEGCYERSLFRRAGELIQQLIAELEAVGAGGVQPLRAEAGLALVPVEPTQEMLEAAAEDLRLRGLPMALLVSASECYRAMLAAAPVPRPARRNPQGTPAPQQETPVVRALQSAILSGLSHEKLLEKAHYLMTLTVSQARTIGELQEAAAAPKAPQQVAPAERKPLTPAQRETVFAKAAARLDKEPNLSWRHALIEETEAEHGIKGEHCDAE